MNQASERTITPELRQWVTTQAAAGHAPAVLLQSMVSHGWNEGAANVALTGALLGQQVEAEQAAALPPPTPVPEPLPGGTRPSVGAGDREVSVLAAMCNPRVVVFGDLLSPDECEEIISLARARLKRSKAVQTDTGGSEVHPDRTSEGMFFKRGEYPVCKTVEARFAELMQWPLEKGEGLQVLRYGPGAEYKPHYDYFDPALPGTPSILKRGGQRVATLVCYLNTPTRGGATVFPDIQLEVAPVQGNAVFFSYDRAHSCSRSLHGGAPVVEGEKWVVTKWLREGVFV
jgi:prolyl 4-hydroxylase